MGFREEREALGAAKSKEPTRTQGGGGYQNSEHELWRKAAPNRSCAQ